MVHPSRLELSANASRAAGGTDRCLPEAALMFNYGYGPKGPRRRAASETSERHDLLLSGPPSLKQGRLGRGLPVSPFSPSKFVHFHVWNVELIVSDSEEVVLADFVENKPARERSYA